MRYSDAADEDRSRTMRKLVVKEWMTLDGVFDAATMDQWWTPYDSAERQQAILEVYARGDAYLLGRTTYEMLWPYWSTQTDDDGAGALLNRMMKYVVSTTLSTAPWKDSTIIRGDVVNEIAALKQQPGQDIILDGSACLVHALMGTGLIDEYRFLVTPILMGKGRRFFTDGLPPTTLRLVESTPLSKGVLALTYQPATT
jgi:dihydrofolate reductase